jgi:hypothetical protein
MDNSDDIVLISDIRTAAQPEQDPELERFRHHYRAMTKYRELRRQELEQEAVEKVWGS